MQKGLSIQGIQMWNFGVGPFCLSLACRRLVVVVGRHDSRPTSNAEELHDVTRDAVDGSIESWVIGHGCWRAVFPKVSDYTNTAQ